jgi:hypothetical protein
VRTAARPTADRRRIAGSRPRSTRKSIHGQRQKTDVWGKKSHCENVSESPNATAARTAERRLAPSSEAHSHIPDIASTSFATPVPRNAAVRGRISAGMLNGENAADWLLAISGVPHPFQTSRNGSAPDLHATRTASLQGTICVMTSSR